MKTDLTQDELKNLLDYDHDTGIFTWKRRKDKPGIGGKTWNTKFCGKKAGWIASNGYRQIQIGGKISYLSHRLAWLFCHGEWPKNEIDHINGIRDDNRICNLRQANRSENQQNIKCAYFRNKTGLLGVHWCTHKKKYIAKIMDNGKAIHIGSFDSAELAHNAYLLVKRQIHAYNLL